MALEFYSNLKFSERDRVYVKNREVDIFHTEICEYYGVPFCENDDIELLDLTHYRDVDMYVIMNYLAEELQLKQLQEWTRHRKHKMKVPSTLPKKPLLRKVLDGTQSQQDELLEAVKYNTLMMELHPFNKKEEKDEDEMEKENDENPEDVADFEAVFAPGCPSAKGIVFRSPSDEESCY
ncbi:hypothetical protein Goklo_023263 [Gossypium klotzschianum]|uniref:Uncharacterized protein n=1 Tax=Gossypium klotzschianum TaxID=34286 RepID=A0A7J8TQA8_9ROSI|nr:hypothetical protein [Gossypium klotzschianum]